MIKVSTSGSFSKTFGFLHRMQSRVELANLDSYGAKGVAALSEYTPKDTGTTSKDWYYEIVKRPGYYQINWLNSNVVEPGTIPVAVLIQYGHGTRNGGYVQGFDYINPALRDIFQQMANDMWREVTK